MLLKTQDFYEFEDFRLDPAERTLMRGGNFIPVTPKVFETLFALVENAGRIDGKEELMREIWQDRFVEESNLTFNIGMLRKALGDDAAKPTYVETVPRRGYRFIAEVQRVNESLEFEAADLGFGNSANVTIDEYATNGQQIKSNGASSLNGDFSAEYVNAKQPPAKVSEFSLSRVVFYSAMAAILSASARRCFF